MASATLNSLVAASKPAASAKPASSGGGIAAALLGASVGSSAGAAGKGATGAGSTLGGADGAAPATINDFLAMLSGMLETPEGTATGANGAPALAGGSAGRKSDALATGDNDDVSQLYAQLLALMQGSSTTASTQPVDEGALAQANATGANPGGMNAATIQCGVQGRSGNPAADATGSATAASQRELLAKLLDSAGGRSDTASGDGTNRDGDPKSLASLLQSDLKALFGDRSVSDSRGGISLKDLTSLLGQAGAGNASFPAAAIPQAPDPALLQGAAATAPAVPTTTTPDAAAANAGQGHLSAPVGTAAWSEQLGTHLTWMAGNDQQSASLKLTPPHLGPLEVQITVGDDNKASVYFSAPHADTRAALGEALPRLRELFGASGLTLADANVSREPSRQKPRSQASDGSIAKIGAVSGDDLSTPSGVRVAALHAGILDTYA